MKTTMIKSSKTLLLSVVAFMAAMFSTSCSNDNDYYADHMEQKTVEQKAQKTQDVDTYKYNADGLWRLEANGETYTLYVNVPSYDTGGRFTTKFYYNNKVYVGTAELINNVMTFTTDSDSDLKVDVKATFANKDSKQFTADMSINNNPVAKGATFRHLDDPNNITYSIYYSVVDPDNELAAMGVDIKTLNDEVKALNNKMDTGNQRVDTALGVFGTQQFLGSFKLSTVIKNQCKTYPALANSKVYVETYVVETFGDINTEYGTSKVYYNIVNKEEK